MTMLDIQPSATLRRQDVVAMNTNMILSNSGLMKKDLAKAMGLSPQSMASRLQSKADWTIDETCAAADFFGVPLMALLDENLTPAKAMEYIKNRRSDNGNDGQLVAGHGFEPWTSGSKVQIHGASSELIQAQFSRVKIRMPMMDHEKQNQRTGPMAQKHRRVD